MLKNCPECNQPVSTAAVTCPACGYPIQKSRSPTNSGIPTPSPADRLRRPWGLLSVFFLAAYLFVEMLSGFVDSCGTTNHREVLALLSEPFSWATYGCFGYWLLDKFAINRRMAAKRYPTLLIATNAMIAGAIIFTILSVLVPGITAARLAAQRSAQANIDQKNAQSAVTYEDWIESIVAPRIEQTGRVLDDEVDQLPQDNKTEAAKLYGQDWSWQLKQIRRAGLGVIAQYDRQIAMQIYKPADMKADVETLMKRRIELERRLQEPNPQIEQEALAACKRASERAEAAFKTQPH